MINYVVGDIWPGNQQNNTSEMDCSTLMEKTGERHRKIVSSALHINILQRFEEKFAKNNDILANKLKALTDGITAHDIPPYLTRCSLDIKYHTSSRINMDAEMAMMIPHWTTSQP